MSRKHEEYWQAIRGRRDAKGCLKILCANKALFEQKPAKNGDGIANGNTVISKDIYLKWD
jgi:hypothetical protein